MTCPFLKEAQVKYCRTAAVRKLIPLAQAGRADEKCSSGEHRHLPGLPDAAAEESADRGPCPFLRESLMQYCARGAGRQVRALQRIAALALRQR